jgi:integrase/recombinase XerD
MKAYITLFKKGVTAAGLYPVKLCIYDPRTKKRQYLLLDDAHHCFIDQFDDKAKQFKPNFKNHKKHNEKLTEAVDIANDILDKWDKGIFNMPLFLKLFLNIANDMSVKECFDFIIKKTAVHGTSQAFENCRDAILKFKPNTILSDITPQWLMEFETYHLAKPGNEKGGVASYMRSLRSVLNKAATEKLYDMQHYPFGKLGYSINTRLKVKPKPIYVPKDIINVIRQKDVKISADLSTVRNNQELARDVFIFSYVCRGMSFVDIAKARWSDIREDRLYYVRQKVSTPISLRLNAEAVAIIEKYKAVSNNGYLFPIYNDATHVTEKQRTTRKKTALKHINASLKALGIEGFNLSTSVARDSFANEAKRRGVETSAIKDLFAHQSITTTEIYLSRFPDSALDNLADEIVQ